ncbi:MAG: hypothetical protein ACYS47_18250, partial [Planctomycetota bacterium]
MRQMFRRARYLTFRGGLLNVFGFQEKTYGFVKLGRRVMRDVEMTPSEAMEFAGIDELKIPSVVRRRWRKRSAMGFTVVIGEDPEKFTGRATVDSILARLRVHPQVRRLVAHKKVYAMKRGEAWGRRITLPKIHPMRGFEKPLEIRLPRKVTHKRKEFVFRNSKHRKSRLILRTSDRPFARGSELAVLNGIDIIGEIGCIGTYRMNELGLLRYSQEAESIYGECECPILEDPKFNCVTNARDKLVENDHVRALLAWIADQVDRLSARMARKRRKDRVERDLQHSTVFIGLLDRWKNRFMGDLSEILFGGTRAADSFGGVASAGKGRPGKGKSFRGGRGKGKKARGKSGRFVATPKEPTMPRVLLSGYHADPLDDSETRPFVLSEDHPPVYQRDVDVPHYIFWVNTSKSLAARIMDHDGVGSIRWREYLFQRMVDVIVKQSLHELGKRSPSMSGDEVDQMIDKVTSKVHDSA